MSKLTYDEPLVVVFGGAGYIGSCLIRQLLEEGYYVRSFDNFMFGDHGVQEIKHPNFECVFGDICDIRAVTGACMNADVVVLLAGHGGKRMKNLRRADVRNVNLLANSAVLDAAVEHGATRFVYGSCDSVYGVQNGVMYETTMPEPVSLYARLKLRMEERVFRRAGRDFHPVCLRIPTCFGFSERMRFDLVPNLMVRDAVYRKKITVRCGEQWRSVVHVKDAANAIATCIKAHDNLVSGEVFNVGANHLNYQIKQIASIVNELVPESEIVVEQDEPDLPDYHLSCSKIAKILDFKAQFELAEGLMEVRDKLLDSQFGNAYSLKYQND